MTIQFLRLISSFFNFLALNPGFQDWPKVILPMEVPHNSSEFWKSCKIWGARSGSHNGPLSDPRKSQNPLNSLLSGASGLLVRYPILDLFWGPDTHFLKEMLKDLIDFQSCPGAIQLLILNLQFLTSPSESANEN